MAVQVLFFPDRNDFNFDPGHISVNILGPSSLAKLVDRVHPKNAIIKSDGLSHAIRPLFTEVNGPTLSKAIFGVATNNSGLPAVPSTCTHYNRCSVHFPDLQESKDINVSTKECGSLVDSSRCLSALSRTKSFQLGSNLSYPFHVLSFDATIHSLETKHAGQWAAFFYSYYYLFDPFALRFIRHSSQREAAFEDSINSTQFLVVGMILEIFSCGVIIYIYFLTIEDRFCESELGSLSRSCLSTSSRERDSGFCLSFNLVEIGGDNELRPDRHCAQRVDDRLGVVRAAAHLPYLNGTLPHRLPNEHQETLPLRDGPLVLARRTGVYRWPLLVLLVYFSSVCLPQLNIKPFSVIVVYFRG